MTRKSSLPFTGRWELRGREGVFTTPTEEWFGVETSDNDDRTPTDGVQWGSDKLKGRDEDLGWTHFTSQGVTKVLS